MSNPYKNIINENQRKKSKIQIDVVDEIVEWREHWREAGPIQFAEEILTCPQDVPPHPDLGVIPEFVILADDQRIFLEDIWLGRINYFILAAGRGCGKTFILSIYVTWRLCCFDNFTMTVMGGSGEQSEKIKEYVDFWRRRDENIAYCLYRSVAGGGKAARVSSRWESFARFPACSIAGARGPHVTQLLIDEVCVGESRGKDGAQAIQDATYQLTSSANQLMGYTSTAQYILGTFYETWTNADELQYKKYRWSLARHKSSMWYTKDEYGRQVPNWSYIDEILYKDNNPDNWMPNVWWVTQRDIEAFRRKSSNDQWLVEILGGISRGSGLVFARKDLDAIICNGSMWNTDKNECETCEPYTDSCPMMKALKLTLPMIGDRRAGGDFGEVSPNAFTVVGRRGGVAFVLYSDELVGVSGEDVLDWMEEKGKEYGVYYIFADPEERGQREALENREFSCPHVWAEVGGGQGKNLLVVNVKRFVEKRRMLIPKKFEYLTTSMKQLAFDSTEKIRKHNDHSWDSLMYGMKDYDIDDMIGVGFYSEIKDREIPNPW